MKVVSEYIVSASCWGPVATWPTSSAVRPESPAVANLGRLVLLVVGW